MKQNLVTDVLSAILILLFVYTAINKIADMKNFQFVLGHMKGIRSITPFIAWSIPLTELFISILLIIPSYKKAGFICSAVLLSIFTGYLFWMLLADQDLPCSCGGVLNFLTWKQHLVFNLVFIILSLIGYRIPNQKKHSRLLLQ